MNYRKYLDENLSPHKQRDRDLWRALGVAANGRLDVEVSGHIIHIFKMISRQLTKCMISRQ